MLCLPATGALSAQESQASKDVAALLGKGMIEDVKNAHYATPSQTGASQQGIGRCQ
jgi:hypothetical protein